jgi:hypothetical protein
MPGIQPHDRIDPDLARTTLPPSSRDFSDFHRSWLERGREKFLADPWAELLRLKPLVREGNRTAVFHPMALHVELISDWVRDNPATMSTVFKFANMIIGNPYHPKDLAFANALKAAMHEIATQRNREGNAEEQPDLEGAKMPPVERKLIQKSLFD